MTVRLDFRNLGGGDLHELERLLAMAGRRFAAGSAGQNAVRLLLLALDVHRAEGNRRPGVGTVRIFTDAADDADRERLAAMLKQARDAEPYPRAMRSFLDGLLATLNEPSQPLVCARAQA